MGSEERLARLERLVLGDSMQEPGIATRIALIQSTLEQHVAETAGPTRQTLLALLLGALISAGVGYAVTWMPHPTPAQASVQR